MQKITSYYRASLAGLTLLCAGHAAAQAPPVPPPVKAAPATAWAKSVKIIPVSAPETDEQDLLDLSMWRFDIMAPKPTHIVEFIVEVQGRNNPADSLLDVSLDPRQGWPSKGKFSVFVGQYLLYDGSQELTAAKTKYLFKVSSRQSGRVIMIGGTTSKIVDNPFIGVRTLGTSLRPEQRPDGSFVLSYGNKSYQSNPTLPDVALVFRVEEESY
jgi:hypothetical protein